MAKENIKVSFVVPVYNVEEYLRQCVESILNQTVDNWELFLIDSGSTDSSGKICDEYGEKDSRIHVVHQKNIGPASARNLGLGMATGDWVSFVDSDDWIEQDYIEKLQVHMHTDVDIIFFAYEIVSESGKKKILDKNAPVTVVSELDMKILEKQSIDTGIGKKNSLIEKCRGQVWTKLYRRSFLVDNHLRIRKKLVYSEDVMFNLEVYGKAKSGVAVPCVLYHYRNRKNSLSHSFNERQIEFLLAFVEEMGKYLKESGKIKEYKQEYYLRVIFTIVNCCFMNYCHPENKNGYFKRRHAYRELRQRPLFAEALKNIKISHNMNFAKRIIAWAVIKDSFLMLNILSWAEKSIKRG